MLASTEPRAPESASNFYVNLVALAAGLAALFAVLRWHGPNPRQNPPTKARRNFIGRFTDRPPGHYAFAA